MAAASSTAGEVLLDAGLADANGIELGDTVTVHGALGSETLTVVGTGYDFTDCLYPNCDPPHLWTTSVTMAGLADLDSAARLVPVDVDDGDPKADYCLVDDLRAGLGGALLGWNDWADTRGDMLVETDFFGAFLGGFGVFVMLSCAVVVASAMEHAGRSPTGDRPLQGDRLHVRAGRRGDPSRTPRDRARRMRGRQSAGGRPGAEFPGRLVAVIETANSGLEPTCLPDEHGRGLLHRRRRHRGARSSSWADRGRRCTLRSERQASPGDRRFTVGVGAHSASGDGVAGAASRAPARCEPSSA